MTTKDGQVYWLTVPKKEFKAKLLELKKEQALLKWLAFQEKKTEFFLPHRRLAVYLNFVAFLLSQRQS